MYNKRSIKKALQRLGALLAMTTLAACGGGSSEEQAASDCPLVIGVITAGLGCIGNSNTSSPTTPPAPVSPPPATTPPQPPGSNVVQMAFAVEYEPNNTLDNANPVSFKNAAPDEHIGIDIRGSVNQADDTADFFIFTPPRSGQFLFYMCADACTDTLLSDEVYVMVYDQSQSTLTSTPVGTVEEQRLAVDLVAGLAYYVEINGYNTGTTAEEYRLVIID